MGSTEATPGLAREHGFKVHCPRLVVDTISQENSGRARTAGP